MTMTEREMPVGGVDDVEGLLLELAAVDEEIRQRRESIARLELRRARIGVVLATLGDPAAPMNPAASDGAGEHQDLAGVVASGPV